MNIYQMWLNAANDDHDEGLWVVRDSWSKVVAKVVFVEAMTGNAPYFNSPKVVAKYFTNEGIFKTLEFMRSPGTYAYTRIATPEWGIGVQY